MHGCTPCSRISPTGLLADVRDAIHPFQYMVAALSCSYEANQGGSLSPEVVTAHEAFFSGGIIEANQGGSLKPTRKGQINLLVLTRQTREAASNQLKRPTLLGLGGKPGWQPQASQKGQTLGVEANQGGSLKPLKLRP